MKTLHSGKLEFGSGLLKSLCVAFLLASCSGPDPVPVRPIESPTPTGGKSDDLSNGRLFFNDPRYNLNVLLRGHAGKFGFLEFRQYPNETQLIHLDTWVLGLEPNTSYLLQRAVDTELDRNCTGTAWLTLGKGLDPFSIDTDRWGIGKAELFRSVAAIPVGSVFDIHFQIVKASTMEVVLDSDCYQYTVH